MKHSIPLQFILCSAFLVPLSGCVDAGDPVVILRNLAPGEDCVTVPEQTADFISRGIIDVTNVGTSSGYLFTPLIQNLAVASENRSSLFFVSGANVDLGFLDGLFDATEIAQFKAEGNSRFVQEFSGSVEPGGLGTFVFEIIPRGMLMAISDKLALGESTRVLAKVELAGELNGGNTSSQIFTYPVDVCKGCLANDLGSCDQVSLTTEVRPGGMCQPLQDGIVDCCTRGEDLLCPAPKSAAPE